MCPNPLSTLFNKLAPKPLERVHLALDSTALAASGCAAVLHPAPPASLPAIAAACAVPALVWLLAIRAVHHYHRGKNYGILADLVLTGVLLGLTCAAWAVLSFLWPFYSGAQCTANFVGAAMPAVLSLRLAFWTLRTVGKAPPVNAVVVGSGPLAQSTARELAQLDTTCLLGTVCFPGQPVPNAALGTVDQLPALIRAHAIGKVYVASEPSTPLPLSRQVAETCAAFGVSFALPPHVSIPNLDGIRKVDSHAEASAFVHYHIFEHKPIQSFVKRLFDIVTAGSALIVLSPLMLTVALIIKLTSRGPVFFKQERVGIHGRRLYMLKFRSMVVNAEELKHSLMAHNEQTGPVFKMQRDPRVTPFGRFIRKHSIDELPQLINILRGDMTIVGPRPAVPAEVAQYEPWQRKRLSVLPGLTCTWQVSGRNQIPFARWMAMDIEYITTWSFKQDIALILRTVPVVLSGRGAS
jgi:exopolysaccharide biosynthesis polyprenyl glycosylphosphotransferase